MPQSNSEMEEMVEVAGEVYALNGSFFRLSFFSHRSYFSTHQFPHCPFLASMPRTLEESTFSFLVFPSSLSHPYQFVFNCSLQSHLPATTCSFANFVNSLTSSVHYAI
ncbi:hypothetical protein CROQUDRAFT_654676 [Cronartium quercuum f. sp. fusiforme G11]|uniref:Uncharacterized protein n=1 Tax=Cronartium quercuum f. sp. fusiforme G11 TaxID=708437 RepID=A0A9P6NS63_9BASI|nr:hypothetical protein CROQUDRAFT_654676 [Cronartium quercuum f. sp. fusiforme G11]